MQNIADERVKNYLAHFPEKISQDLVDYATNEVFKKSRYIFTNRKDKKDKQQYGYCTHCKEEFETPGFKHNEAVTCPKCGSFCKAKDSFRGRKSLYDEAYFVYYEKSVIDPKVIVARGIYVVRDYSGDYKKVETQYVIEAWYIFDMKNGSKMLKMPSWWAGSREPYITNSIQCLFCKYNQNYMKYVGYSKNSIKKAVEGTPFSWSGWESYDYKDMTAFFDLYTKFPCIEYLTKLGFTNLVEDKLYGSRTYRAINWRGKDLFKVLKINKQEFGEIKYKKIDVTFWFLNLYKINKKENWGLSIEETAAIASKYNEYYFEDLKEMLIYGHIKKITSYLEKQRKKNSKHYYSQLGVLRDWKDYIKDCKKLEMDIRQENILFPRDLYKAHQKTIKLIKYKADKILNDKIKARLKDLNKYYFEYEGLLIRPAANSDELITEGKKLCHCVGGYAARYAEGETTILLIREKDNPDRPYYTVEIRKNEITQTRGKNNCAPNGKVQAFIKAFTKEKLSKPNKKKKNSKTKVSVPA